MADLLKWNHATVTVCHSKTLNLPDIVSMHGISFFGKKKKHSFYMYKEISCKINLFSRLFIQALNST